MAAELKIVIEDEAGRTGARLPDRARFPVRPGASVPYVPGPGRLFARGSSGPARGVRQGRVARTV